MTPLGALIAQRDGAVPLLRTDGADLTAGALAGAGVPAGLCGARVALCLADPAALVTALVALDGRAAALLLVSRALPAADVMRLVAAAEAAVLVTDRTDLAGADPGIAVSGISVRGLEVFLSAPPPPSDPVATQWLMTTSGTTGLPKIVPHSLASLARTVSRMAPGTAPRWGLIYDPTRFAGMQVVLQALLGGGTLIAPDTAHAPLAAQVAMLARHGCTHLSATPTLWRRLLMVPGIGALPLVQATLGGETVDQAILDALAQAFPAARRTHIYASTEAGVGFSVTDGRAGFPAAWLDSTRAGVALRCTGGTLWLCPPQGAGFIDSGDLVTVEGDRAHFLGRAGGVINVGGVKVHPEAVEAVIRTVPGVRLVRVTGRRSPITGALVMAEVLADEGAEAAALRPAIQAACRAALPREAVPGVVRLVEDMEMNAAGKLIRRGEASGGDSGGESP